MHYSESDLVSWSPRELIELVLKLQEELNFIEESF